MKQHGWHFGKSAIQLALLFAVFSQLANAITLTPPTTITRGPFEIVAQGRAITSGGLFSPTSQPGTTTEATDFTLKCQGTGGHRSEKQAHPCQRCQRCHRCQRANGTSNNADSIITNFRRVVRLTDAPRPTLLVATTEFRLLTEAQGTLVVRHFESDVAGYQWLDADNGQPSQPAAFAIEKVDLRTGTELRGGR